MISYKQRNNTVKLKHDIVDMYKLSKGCAICGYNKCGAALEFHHIDADEKIGTIAVLINKNVDMDVITEEIKKCIVLCANCHRELHKK